MYVCVRIETLAHIWGQFMVFFVRLSSGLEKAELSPALLDRLIVKRENLQGRDSHSRVKSVRFCARGNFFPDPGWTRNRTTFSGKQAEPGIFKWAVVGWLVKVLEIRKRKDFFCPEGM